MDSAMEMVVAGLQEAEVSSEGRLPEDRSGSIPAWKWTPYSDLALHLTVAVPLQEVTLAFLSGAAEGTVLSSNWLVSDYVPLWIDDTFLANVCFEPAGANLGVRISDFALRGAPADMRAAAHALSQPDAGLEDVLRLKTSLCFGTTQMRLEDVMKLAIGDIAVLSRAVNAPVKVTAGGHVVASGDLIVVAGCYAVQLTTTARMSQELKPR